MSIIKPNNNISKILKQNNEADNHKKISKIQLLHLLDSETYTVDKNEITLAYYYKKYLPDGIVQIKFNIEIIPEKTVIPIPVNPALMTFIPRLQHEAQKYQQYKINTLQVTVQHQDNNCMGTTQIHTTYTKGEKVDLIGIPCGSEYVINTRQEDFQPVAGADFLPIVYLINFHAVEFCQQAIKIQADIELKIEKQHKTIFRATNPTVLKGIGDTNFNVLYVIKYEQIYSNLIYNLEVTNDVKEIHWHECVVFYANGKLTEPTDIEKCEAYIKQDNAYNNKLPEFKFELDQSKYYYKIPNYNDEQDARKNYEQKCNDKNNNNNKQNKKKIKKKNKHYTKQQTNEAKHNKIKKYTKKKNKK